MGKEIRDLTILNKHIDSMDGLQILCAFSDNCIILCEVGSNERFNPAACDETYPENRIPQTCQYIIQRLTRVTVPAVVVSFGVVSRLKSDQAASWDASVLSEGKANCSGVEGRGESNYVPVMTAEGGIKLVEVKGYGMAVLEAALQGVRAC